MMADRLDLFLLMLNLSQMQSSHQVMSVFNQSLAEIYRGCTFCHIDEGNPGDQSAIPIATMSNKFGSIQPGGHYEKLGSLDKALIRNAVGMLAVILERRMHIDRLSNEKQRLDELVRERTKELIEKNFELEKVNFQLQNEMKIRSRIQTDRDRIFNLSIDLICICGFDGYLKFINPAWSQVLGWSTDELYTSQLVDFIHPDDTEKTIDVISKLQSGMQVLLFENRCRRKNGSFCWLSWNLYPVTEERIFYAIARDMTRPKELEEQLRQSEKMLAIGELAGGVAHDFNNQLAGISGFSELLLENCGDDPMLREYARNIILCVKRSSDLTGKLLSFSRKTGMNAVLVDVNALVDEVIDLLKHSIDKKIKISKALRADPGKTMGDPSQLQNAILNLALNSRDAMLQGGELKFTTSLVVFKQIPGDLEPWQLAPGKYLKIDVMDTGTGITDDVKRRMFEPFFTTKEAGKGSGMGCAAVYSTIKVHKGAILVDTYPQIGTTISLFLPVSLTSAEKKESVISKKVDKESHKGLHVLVVDDDDMICGMIRTMLDSMGFGVETCHNGHEACALFESRHHETDCVILDVMMPLMTLEETFYTLKQIDPEVKILLTSGYAADESSRRLLCQGASGFIQKPFSRMDLLEKLDEMLAVHPVAGGAQG